MPIDFGDERWTDEKWYELLDALRSRGLISWKEIAGLTLGHLNPSQVGTSLASSDGFKRRYGKGNTMRVVMEWFYSQDGRCVDCGTRLELQADHNDPRESFDDPLDADFIENMVLRCRRCNVVRRPSHQFGGHTHLTAEAALMWILFELKPRTVSDFIRMCRIYGMTMANIRMDEGWAMAHWLAAAGDYTLDDGNRACDVLRWTDDNALTRCWKGDEVPGRFDVVHEDIAPSDQIVFAAAASDDKGIGRVTAFRMPIFALPFSHYFEGHGLPGQSLAISYSPPERKKVNGNGPRLLSTAPRGMFLLGHDVVRHDADATVAITGGASRGVSKTLAPTGKRARLCSIDPKAIGDVTVTIT